jgi:DMSO/TMAO reductase YedYZ molybdopterin-dependent catalytic subunit
MNSPIQPSHSKTREELDEEVRHLMARKSRRSFLIGGAAALAALGAYKWLDHAPQVEQLQKPLRMAENANAAISKGLFRENILAPSYPINRATLLRVNGDIGLNDLVLDSWRLQVVGLDRPEHYSQFTPNVDLWNYRSTDDPAPNPDASQGADVKGESAAQKAAPTTTGLTKTPGILLTIADIHKLPRVEMVTQFKCIEGWSQICQWEGARFSDFIKVYPPRLSADGSPPKYAAMETPEGDFFSGYDMASLLHPQTLLCYSMGGKPLSPGHGAPLRIAMPLKYGYKQIKQIAKITYTNQKPADYWANLGYDWYGGI